MLSALSGEMILRHCFLSLVFVQRIVAARIFRKYCRHIIQTHAPCFLRVTDTDGFSTILVCTVSTRQDFLICTSAYTDPQVEKHWFRLKLRVI